MCDYATAFDLIQMREWQKHLLSNSAEEWFIFIPW